VKKRKLRKPNKNKPRVGDLWLWQTMPPMLFCYIPEDGWMMLYADIFQIGNLLDIGKLAGHEPIRSKDPPPNARRYAE
jgi:hypothetical protein